MLYTMLDMKKCLLILTMMCLSASVLMAYTAWHIYP